MKPAAHVTRARAGWAGFAAVCVCALLVRFPVAGIPLERDEGEYAYTAQRWLQGELPYRDSFDQKPPGIHLMYVLLESVVGTTPAAIHWGTQFYTLGTLAVLFVLGRRLASPAAGLAAAAFTAFMTIDPSVLGNASNTEVFMLLPLTGALLSACLAGERASLGWAFITGACAAAALLFKQVAIFNLAFCLVLVAWQSSRPTRSTVTLLVGVACMLLPVSAYFAIHGATDQFFDATVGHNLRYASRLPLALYPQAFWTYFTPCLRSMWPVLLLAATQVGRTLYTWLGTFRSPRGTAVTRNTLLVLAWFGASFLGTASGGFFRPHYFTQSIPPVALLAGMAVGLTRLGRFTAPLRVALTALAIAIGISAYPWYYRPGDVDAKARRIYGTNAVAEAPAVGRFIAAHSDRRDTVFILGSEPQILYYAERKSASRYIIVYPLTGPFPDVRQRQHEALDEIAFNQPRFIVTVSEAYSFLADPAAPTDLTDTLARLVKESYRLAAVAPLAPDAATPLLSGESAAAFWRRAPFSCCSLVVWERLASARPSP